MDNVAIVVGDVDAAVAFFSELGMELEGRGQVEGPWVDRTVGLDGVRSDIAMMRTPDGHGKLELTKYHAPAAVGAGPENPSPNTPVARERYPGAPARRGPLAPRVSDADAGRPPDSPWPDSPAGPCDLTRSPHRGLYHTERQPSDATPAA